MNSEPRNHGSPDGGPPAAESATRATTVPPAAYPREGVERLVVVRFGKMQLRGLFRSRTTGLVYNDRVVVQTERGLEIGEVGFRAPGDPADTEAPEGWVIRRAAPEDLEKHEQLNEGLSPGGEYQFCRERIASLGLPMRLVDVERPFGGGKIIFYFTADGRVDFRGLVRDLAKRYRTRIEMKQIGVRDEAKVLGDIADCGRELCCRTFLTRLQPISMRMAKVQKTTLDPAKISGRCGRLKCCLRYEYDAYIGLRASLPRSGARVRVDGRTATVVGMDILSQQVQVLLDEGERLTVHADRLRPAERRPEGGTAAAAPSAPADRDDGGTEVEESGPAEPEDRCASGDAEGREDEPVPPTSTAEPSAPEESAGGPGAPVAPARGAGARERRSGKRRGTRRGRRGHRGTDSGARAGNAPRGDGPVGPSRDQSSPPTGKGAPSDGGSRKGRRRRRRGRGSRPAEGRNEGGEKPPRPGEGGRDPS